MRENIKISKIEKKRNKLLKKINSYYKNCNSYLLNKCLKMKVHKMLERQTNIYVLTF